jgi:hypothetical protein
MPYSGGIFSRLYNWVVEQASSPIEIAKLDAQEEDFATGLSNCILRDGTGVPTAATPWNGQNLSGVGTLTATLFSGSGASLTALSATNLASGTVPDARFPATLPALSGVNLTALNATNLASGTVADARLSANVPLLDAANIFTAFQTISRTNNSGFSLYNTDMTTANRRWDMYAGSETLRFTLATDDGSSDTAWLLVERTANVCDSANIVTAAFQVNSINVRSLPAITSTSTTLVKGQLHNITGDATLPTLAAGEWVSVVNNSDSAITITKSADTTYWTTGGVSVATLTLAARGRLIATGAGSSVSYVSGDFSGYT